MIKTDTERPIPMTALSLGDSVPDVTMPTASGETLQLANFRGEWLLLVFHRHLM